MSPFGTILHASLAASDVHAPIARTNQQLKAPFIAGVALVAPGQRGRPRKPADALPSKPKSKHARNKEKVAAFEAAVERMSAQVEQLQLERQLLQKKWEVLNSYAGVQELQLRSLNATAKPEEAAGRKAFGAACGTLDETALMLMRLLGLPADHAFGTPHCCIRLSLISFAYQAVSSGVGKAALHDKELFSFASS